MVTRAVQDEIWLGRADYPLLADVNGLPWLRPVSADSLEELRVFNQYVRALGSDTRNIGEASILAWAEVTANVALIDDQTAVNVAKARGVTVRRTLSLIANALHARRLDLREAQTLVDDLVGAGVARFPCDGVTFAEWAERNGLIAL